MISGTFGPILGQNAGPRGKKWRILHFFKSKLLPNHAGCRQWFINHKSTLITCSFMLYIQKWRHPPWFLSSSALNTNKCHILTIFPTKMQFQHTKMAKNMIFWHQAIATHRSYQQNFQNPKSIHFYMSYGHFSEAWKSSQIEPNFIGGVHSMAYSWKMAGWKKKLQVDFLLLGNPNAPQQVKFHY